MSVRRIALYILCISLLLSSLVGCAGESETPPEGTTESDAPVNTAPVEPVEVPDAEAILAAALEIPACSEAALSTRTDADGVCVLGYTGSETRVRIPDRIGDAPVVAIGDGAFAQNKTLTALVLPDGILRVGKGILAGCTSLEVLQTPLLGEDASKPQYLGYLFGSTRPEDNPRDVPASLATLCLRGSWDKLAAYALYDCNDLSLVSLPASVQTLERFSMSRCASLTAIDGIDSIRVLGEHALSFCESLESLSLDAAEKLGLSSLEGCVGLRTLRVPFVGGTETENTYLGYIFGAAYPDFSRGYYPPRLVRVEVTEATALGTNAFFECRTLKEISLPTGLETVGTRAFYGCAALWSVTLPDTVKTVRESAFAGCDSLLSVELGASLSALGINAFLNCDSLISVTLPATLTALPASAFAGCASLSRVDLGGVRTVGAQAFRGCSSLTDVRVGGAVEFGEGNDAIKNLIRN